MNYIHARRILEKLTLTTLSQEVSKIRFWQTHNGKALPPFSAKKSFEE